ncbi:MULTISPECIES: hypothetical protein [Ensifer]|jgi:hypothetical protein|uniref:Uncharacterized protein n=1 Tax=Ensifer canadensis TaxID=555315 RepID=A0AAW4FLZ0_9HYPH|nr:MULTISPECIES: hypothetical protein [Ensifer]MDP9633682.1 hypothetical protein [Ensifer adhaerens]KQU93688.1 hypothetical protein ASD00_23730 [Ensifer sp. Root31]KQW58676.1 hypothetical protein ASD02_06755 [Ensifer sp. Root1252]KQW74380.1 hypothetical protein ASD03_07395 [Ensifer sp. Root127]KQY78713.1 hypothetical protein ASD52_02420 [Ensifer sp. Root142]
MFRQIGIRRSDKSGYERETHRVGAANSQPALFPQLTVEGLYQWASVAINGEAVGKLHVAAGPFGRRKVLPSKHGREIPLPPLRLMTKSSI